jgi:hypothetical protein
MPQELPWYMNLVIAGNDDEGEESGESESEEESEEEESEEEGEDGKEKPPDVEGLKSALTKERRSRREAERDNRRLKREAAEKQQNKDEEASEVELAKAETAKERTKSEKLAMRLRDTAVDNLILKYAGDQFADLDDVLKLIDREQIDVDQDDEDPADVVVDQDTVRDAVKKLAKSKPHLLKITGEGGEGTGSQFGGRKKGSDDALNEEALMARYPALRR